MGVLMLPLLLASFTVTFLMRDTSDIFYTHFISNEPRDAAYLFKENYLLWGVAFVLTYAVLYLPPFYQSFTKWKFNPEWPSNDLVKMELIRSLRGVGLATLFDIAVNQYFRSGRVPLLHLSWMEDTSSIWNILAGILVTYVWGDTHFYFTHRALHHPYLYTNIHKVHHESTNPDPFSGLSMHALESLTYFSAAPLMVTFAPLWVVRLALKALLVFPLEGHSGYGWKNNEHSSFHYIHHAKFNWNFGTSPFWDRLLGTEFKGKLE